ncbi:MAG TPA: tripartite tricarboxylate transporter substrate-binding protein [Burkholderiales bacterium]|jgi:tripartite-type tricarboxylate transporter receptor subunit TctC|nr:tripartite tricarboxylate transporter substrate-binding protein [Burkholderiales bacterium]
MTIHAVLIGALVLGAAHGAVAASDAAGGFPTKPVRLIVAQGTGSSVDTLGRILAVRLTDEWGKQVIVDNRGGAGGIIGAEIASRAAPDGYTLLMSSTAMQVISPQLYKKLSYHPTQDFAQFSLIANTHNVLVVTPSVPFKNVRELIAYAKANPGKLNMANAGSGFQSHLAAVLFTHMANIDLHHIPYKGGTSVTMVAAGESQLTIVPAPSVMGQIRAGRVRPIGVGGEKRSPLLPDVPTIAESGVPGFVSTGWAGIMAPKGLPKPIYDKVYASLIKVMKDATTRELFERQGAEPLTSTPQEMLQHIDREYARFGQAIKLAGLKIQ